MSTWRPDIDVILTDSEDEENEALKLDFTGREAILIVLDANLYKTPELFMQALEIIQGACISGLLVNDKQLMGIMFANTEMSPLPFEPRCLDNIVMPANCAVFLPIRILNKPIVDHYLRFMSTAEKNFGTEYGIAGNNGCGNFAQLLRLCMNLFDQCTYKLAIKDIVYMTDREMPHAANTSEYDMALGKARDLEGKDINFHVIPMVDDFDYDKFYKEFMVLVKDSDINSFEPADPQLLRDRLSNRKLNQSHAKRTLGHFNLSLGANLNIGAQYYNYFKTRTYPRKVKILRKSNRVLEQHYQIMARKQDEDTLEFTQQQHVKMSEGWYEINLGDMAIRITPEQIYRVRNLHSPGMMLLGFKELGSLPENCYYLPCAFMYPDEGRITGSRKLFRALWERCMSRNKIAICLFMRKRKSIPRYVALVPVSADGQHHQQDGVPSTQGAQIPRSLIAIDGFKIVYLPFAKHYRHIDFQNWNAYENESSAEGVDWFEKVVRKMRIKYTPNVINEPRLELLQAKLLALAFDIPTENGGRIEMPNAEKQDERIAELLPAMEELFGIETEPAKKRAASKSSGDAGPTAKTAKVKGDELKDRSYVDQLIKNNALGSCTIAQLRGILEEHFDVNLPKASKKDAIIETIQRCYSVN